MKTKIIMFIVALLLAGEIFAQMEPPFLPGDRQRKRIEELEKVKLIEVLDLDEETMIKFFSKRKVFKDNMQSLWQKRDEMMDKLEDNVRNNASDVSTNMEKMNEILDLETKISLNRKKFVESLKEFMPETEIVKLIVFEHAFKRELRERIFNRRGDRKPKEWRK